MHYLPEIFWILFCLILVAVTVLLYRGRFQRDTLLTGILISIVSVLFTFAVLEVAFRLRHKFVRDIPLTSNINAYFDPDLGWRGVSNYYNTGDTARRILIVGDSFTEGLGLESNKLYPRVVAEDTQSNVKAYGGRGYGTLQELIVIERYAATFKPDIVILQLCSNDIINNSKKLEQESYFQNALMMRPYRIGDQRKLEFPHSFGKVRFFLTSGSRVAHFAFSKVDALNAQLAQKGYLPTVESTIAEHGINYPEYHESVQTTALLLQEIKEEVGDKPLIVFLADDIEPARSIYRGMTSELDIVFLEEIAEKMSLLRNNGADIFHQDQVHWNENGHEIVGRLLSEYIKMNY